MIYLCLDLESIRDPAIPFASNDPDTFAPLPCHQIVCGCWGKLTVTPEAAKLELGGERDERALLRRLARQWPHFSEHFKLITYGGRRFDVGEIDDVFRYCKKDVVLTTAVLAGSEHLAGRWTTEMREMALAECWREWEALGGV